MIEGFDPDELDGASEKLTVAEKEMLGDVLGQMRSVRLTLEEYARQWLAEADAADAAERLRQERSRRRSANVRLAVLWVCMAWCLGTVVTFLWAVLP